MDKLYQSTSLDNSSTSTPRSRPQFLARSRYLLLAVICCFCLLSPIVFDADWPIRNPFLDPAHETFACEQRDAIVFAGSPELHQVRRRLETPESRAQSATLLSGAVKIPSVSYDDMGPVSEDPRWDVFSDVAAYLDANFPAVHHHLDLTKINSYGLLYTWLGSDPHLKPIVLMAHQDVVPVDSIDKWTYPPFSGKIDDEFVHGRGASDCKNVLIGIMESIEALLSADFKPARTIILAFGFDEEISGTQGALQLAKYIEEVYGHDGVAMILDEGAGFSEVHGQIFATPGVAEKGYLDATITVTMPGGHSSIPPDHTAIGILSKLLVEIENDPYEVKLTKDNPLYQQMVCGAKHAPSFPSKLRHLLDQGNIKALALELKANLQYRYLMATSVAETVINGGVKVNALPETATAVINHRISIDETSVSVARKLTELATRVAKKHGLTISAFDDTDPALSSINLRSGIDTLEPAQITLLDTAQYKILSGTIRSVFPKVLVSPAYWNLTRHIFRFEPSLSGYLEGSDIHTVNERMSIDGHVELVKFFLEFIVNIQNRDI